MDCRKNNVYSWTRRDYFHHLKRRHGAFQGLLKKDILGEEKFDFWNEVVDIGDFVEVRGKFFYNQKRRENDWRRKIGRCFPKVCVLCRKNGMGFRMRKKDSANAIWIF